MDNTIKLHNSITRKSEEFTPLVEGKVSIYSCGPTVYNTLHIGNLSTFIYSDLLRRMFLANGYKVHHVMNITDVDDKTIRDSKAAHPGDEPMDALLKFTQKYTKIFIDDLQETGNDIDALELISAVDSIPGMIKIIKRLLDADIAYIADDGVYFSITKYYQSGKKYGVLQLVKTQQSKARILNDEYDKDSASDFALWKRAGEGEPAWEATFSEDAMETVMPGRPGWHIECSAMIEDTLGLPIDIHTGGIDLKFPHHENEIAQCVGAGAEKLANCFMHNNHLLVDGKKMSKSANNFHTLSDIKKKGFSAQTFRLMVLESHYHSESNFSWDILQASQNRLKNWQSIADLRWQLPEDETDISSDIISALSDNLNSPQALKEIELYFDRVAGSSNSPSMKTLETIHKVLGIDLHQSDIKAAEKTLLKKRSVARTAKDWAKSDTIRTQLEAKGITVRDDASGQLWSRI